jgi:hypothetical protein
VLHQQHHQLMHDQYGAGYASCAQLHSCVLCHIAHQNASTAAVSASTNECAAVHSAHTVLHSQHQECTTACLTALLKPADNQNVKLALTVLTVCICFTASPSRPHNLHGVLTPTGLAKSGWMASATFWLRANARHPA